jgi:hypothetical protein
MIFWTNKERTKKNFQKFLLQSRKLSGAARRMPHVSAFEPLSLYTFAEASVYTVRLCVIIP